MTAYERKVHYAGPDDRWPACGRMGYVETTAEAAEVSCGQCNRNHGRRTRGTMLRVSCDLPAELVERLEHQAQATGRTRQSLLEAAVLDLVADLERVGIR